MSYIYDPQTILITQPEPVWCEFRNTEGELVSATNARITIFDPNGSTVVSSASMTQQSTGVYYYVFETTANYVQGDYQAWFSGQVDGLFTTIDQPKALYVRQMPWDRGLKYEFVQSVRRAVGDYDPSNYRIQDRDLIYFISEAVDELQMQLPMGYTISVDPDGITFNKTLTTRAEVLFKWQTVLLILESIINANTSDVGIIQMGGDIKIDKTRHYDSKLKRLQLQYEKVQNTINTILTEDLSGVEIITYGKGDPISIWWDEGYQQ